MVNRLDYIIKKVVVDKSNIEQFFAQYPTKRQVRASQQKNLLSALRNGGTFPVMYVNRSSTISNKNVVLDGNHRLEALRQYLEENPEAAVELFVGVYDIADPEMERAKFLELNNVVKPSSDDVIQQYIDDNETLKRVLRMDNVSIYGTSRKPLKVRVLMNAYIQAVKPKWKPTITSGQEIVAHMDNYDMQDIRNIKAFLEQYQDFFGMITKDSTYMKTTVFTVMMRIWIQNKDRINEAKMKQKFRLLMNHTALIEASQHGGNAACIDYSIKFIDVLNRTGRNYGFVLETIDEE